MTEKEQATLNNFEEQLVAVRRNIFEEKTKCDKLTLDRLKLERDYNKDVSDYLKNIEELSLVEKDLLYNFKTEKESLDNSKDYFVDNYNKFKNKLSELINNSNAENSRLKELSDILINKIDTSISIHNDLNNKIIESNTIIERLKKDKEELINKYSSIEKTKENNILELSDKENKLKKSIDKLNIIIENKTKDLDSINKMIESLEYNFNEKIKMIKEAQDKADADISKAKILIARANRLWSKFNPHKDIEQDVTL